MPQVLVNIPDVTEAVIAELDKLAAPTIGWKCLTSTSTVMTKTLF